MRQRALLTLSPARSQNSAEAAVEADIVSTRNGLIGFPILSGSRV
jgi:hypothetical protein